MTLAVRIVIGVVVVVVLSVGGAVAAGGLLQRPSDTHPPCDQLPAVAEATAALARNRPLAAEIEALGDDVVVAVGKPCPRGQDRALIEVRYGSGSERNAIADLLAQRDGFGVPVYLVKR